MANIQEPTVLPEHRVYKNYTTGSLEDEMRITQLCKQLLIEFHQYLLDEKQLDPLTASDLTGGADYFLRDFMIDSQRANIFEGSELYLKKFAANWYIISNLEPNIEELRPMLDGAASFYSYCSELNLVTAETAIQIEAASKHLEYYQQRIEKFHDITGDGFSAWNSECPLK